jgi:hypothetical protein
MDSGPSDCREAYLPRKSRNDQMLWIRISTRSCRWAFLSHCSVPAHWLCTPSRALNPLILCCFVNFMTNTETATICPSPFQSILRCHPVSTGICRLIPSSAFRQSHALFWRVSCSYGAVRQSTQCKMERFTYASRFPCKTRIR